MLTAFAQNLGVNLDGLATVEQVGHWDPRHARHLNVVVHEHQLVQQPLWQIGILQGQASWQVRVASTIGGAQRRAEGVPTPEPLEPAKVP